MVGASEERVDSQRAMFKALERGFVLSDATLCDVQCDKCEEIGSACCCEVM